MAEYKNPLLLSAIDSSYSNPLSVPKLSSSIPVQSSGGIEPGMSSFQSGLRAGAMGTQANLRGFAANIAETAGFPEYAKSQLQEISKIQSQIPRARVERLEDIQSVGDVPSFISYNTGAAAPTMATAAAGALGARFGLRALGAKPSPYVAELAGSAAGIFPQEAGEAAVTMYNDPYVMANTTPGERTALMTGKGAVGSALESVVPAAVLGKIAAPVTSAVKPGVKNALSYVGKEALKDASIEALTEGAQQVSGQAFQSLANPNVSPIPSRSEVLNAMAAGFFPGGAMGAVGGGIDVLKSNLARPVESVMNPLQSMASAARNPQLSAFVDTLAPADVKAKGANAITDWIIQNPDAVNRTILAASNVANDDSLPDSVRANARRVVDTNGSPESIREMTGIATSSQQGLEFGKTVRDLMDSAFQAANGIKSRFSKNADGETKFSAMDVKPTGEEMFVQKQLTPYLAVKNNPELARAATASIQDYLLSSAENPAARMPAGLMNLFEQGKAQEGLKAAFASMYRAGLVSKEAEADVSVKIDDALKRRDMWRDLLKSETSPQFDIPSDKDLDVISSSLERLSTQDSPEFNDIVNSIFGSNAARALSRMEPLLPSTTPSLLSRQLGANDEQALLDSTNEAAPSIIDQTATMGEDEAKSNVIATPSLNIQDYSADVKWTKLGEGAYDTLNPEQLKFLNENKARADRSGVTQTGEVGIVDYAKRTNDFNALRAIQQQNPELTDADINNRYKVLATYQRGEPVPEQVTYDELVAPTKRNAWKDTYAGEGSLRFYEPGKTKATVRTSANALITAIRQKAGQLESDLVGPEQNMADFSRAVASIINAKKGDSMAFDKVTVMVKDPEARGKNALKEVPLTDLPDDFSLFPNVTVKDVRKATSSRLLNEGQLGRKMTDVSLADMPVSELVARFNDLEAKLSQKSLAASAKEYFTIQLKAIVTELKARIALSNLDTTAESIVRNPTPAMDRELPPRSDETNLKSLERSETKIVGTDYTYIDRDTNGNLMSRATAQGMMKPGDILTKINNNFVIKRPTGFKTATSSVMPDETEAMGTAEEGPRLYDEWGLPTDPRETVYMKSTNAGAKAYAARLANLITSSETQNSLSSTLIKTLREVYASNDVPSVKLQKISGAERLAVINGLITPEQAESRHFFKKNGKIVITPKKDKYNAQNSMDPLVSEPMHPDDKKELAAWLKEVLPEHILEFVSDLGGMSGSFSRTNLGKALIKINVFAFDPMGVAYHEAFHALFSEMRAGNHAEAINVMNKVAMSGRVQSQLRQLLETNPAALNQLADPEEAAAYMFQFWQQEKLNLGPQTESFFKRLVTAIKEFFGFIEQEKLVEEMFTLFSSGALKEEISRDDAFTRMGSPVQNRLLDYAKPVLKNAEKYVRSVESLFRKSGNEHLINIISMFENTVGVASKDLGYFKAVDQVRNHTINKLTESIRNETKDTLDKALTELQKSTDPNSVANQDVKRVMQSTRKLLNQLHDYMTRNNVTNWNGDPIGRLADYFPRVWNMDSLLSDGDEFVRLLVENHSEELQKMAIETGGDHSAQDVAEALFAKMVRNMGVADTDIENQSGLSENETTLGFSPALNAANERVLKFLDMSKFEKFLEKDYVTTMTRYIHQATKKAEYSSRFGSNGEKLQDMMDAATELEFDKLMAKEYGRSFAAKRNAALDNAIKNNNESQEDFEDRVLSSVFEDYARAKDKVTAETEKLMRPYRNGIMALEGTLGHDISSNLRKINSTVGAYQNLRVLPLALLSSLIDPLGIVVRGGKLEHAKTAFLRGMKEVYKGWTGDFTGAEDKDVRIAELMGTLEPSSFLDSLGQTYGSMFLTSGARKINDTLFRINGMEAWNRAMRTQATLAAIDFIKDLKQEGKHNARYMEELGLTVSDINIDDEGNLDVTNPQVRNAIMRWVDGAILRPNAAQRPTWASNPKFALLFHLMQFTYSFQKEILGRVANEAKNGNIDPAFTLAVGYVPMMMASLMIRGMIQGGGELPEYMKDDSLFEWVTRAVFQSGILGVPGVGLQGAGYGDTIPEKAFNIATSYTGPTIKQGIDAVNDDLSTTAAKALPFQVVYRQWFN